MTPTPSSLRRRTTPNRVSTSSSSRIAEGSSMIRTLMSCESARAIETTCCAAGRSGRDARVVEPLEQRDRALLHRVAVQQRAAAQLVAEEHALGHGQVL